MPDAFGRGIGDLAPTPFALLALLFVKDAMPQAKSAIERDAERAKVPA